jgi:hypothetical protein
MKMNKILKSARPSRFLKPGRSLLLVLLLCFCTTAFATPTTPTSDFIDNGDGTVTHKTTGLIWMRCAMGQTWDKATSSCTGTARAYDFFNAVALTRNFNFANKTGWYLPYADELLTIVEHEAINPAINTTIFPNTPNGYFWSSTGVGHLFQTRIVDFSSGNSSIGNIYDTFFIRLMIHGDYLDRLSNADFIDNKDGTVTHKRTGLIWQHCAVGQTWTGTSCSGTATTYTYNQAVTLTDTLAGYNDWRVPNESELLTLTDYRLYKPSINRTHFPNIPATGFWSSSPDSFNSDNAWIASFYYGSNANPDNKNSSHSVLLVRGGQPFDFLPLTTPDADFIDNKDGTVTHKRTRLMWQRCAVGKLWTGTTCSGTESSYGYNDAIALTSTFAGYSDWRVPNANELLSIVEYGDHDPAINRTQFPNMLSYAGFWSSSPDTFDNNNSWSIYFSKGQNVLQNRISSFPVLLVRRSVLSLNIIEQSGIALDFATNYDAQNSKIVELQNTSANPIKISNVLISDAVNYWVNLFIDSQSSCRAKHTAPDSKSFTIAAQSSCTIAIGFSPFDNLTANKSIAATLTLKTTSNNIPVDKVINLTGIGRAQVATLYSESNSSLYGQWGVTQLKGGNPPLKSYKQPKTWYSELTDTTLQKSVAHIGNVVVLAGNSVDPAGHVGVVIQTEPLVMLTTINRRNQSGNIVRRWQVKPVDWYPVKNKAAVTWQPFITGIGTSSDKHYGFIDWNSGLY